MRKLIRVWIVAAGIAGVLSGCGQGGGGGTIRIGVAGPFTGNAAAFGEMIKKGATLKADTINAAGGINGKQIELVFGDDVGDPKEASTVATKFAADRSIVAVIGHFNSSCSLAGKPIYKREGVVELSPGSTNVNVCVGSEWTFRNVYRDDFQGQFLARYVKQKLNLKRVAVFYDNDDYGIGLKNAFAEEAQKQGLEIVGTAAYTRESVDFKPELANFKALNPDAMFVSGLYNEAALVTMQARQQGLTMQILGADGVFSPGYIQVAGKAAEGTLITTPFLFDAGGAGAKEVLKKFKEQYKEDPDCWAALTYDAVGIIAEAVAKAGPDRKAIRDYLGGMTSADKAYPGITGKTYFDANGDCQKPAYVSVVKDGRFVSAPLQMLE
jgi:branched-chain amino acid transport system substrate-binding protein